MVLVGLVIAVGLFIGVYRHLEELRGTGSAHGDWVRHHTGVHKGGTGRRWRREMRRWERAQRRGDAPPTTPSAEEIAAYQAQRHAAAAAGFYTHLLVYLGVGALLALINLFTWGSVWFHWPAIGWGFGLFAHWMAVFGHHTIQSRYVEPVVEREVQREKAAMQTEKQADIGELSSTIAHEIRNPIAAAKSLVQQMAEDPQSIEHQEYARVAVGELDRVERRIAHLLKYAREEDYEFAPAGIAAVVDAALTQLRAKLEAAQVQTMRHYLGGPTVRVDAEKLQGVFVNIVDNAIDALHAHEPPRRLEVWIEPGAGQVVVRLRDNGPGIPPEKLDAIFNPFFTTKANGTGLGMAIAKKTVEAHGGTMAVSCPGGQGTEFAVTLPLPR